ncbi:MAG: hypothetical protein NTY96_10615 [Bacteroidetes bacterium]|nr:hypothetical protein [Bacteroidota bacterium]
MKFSPGLTLVLILFTCSQAGYTQVQPASSNYNAVLSNTGQFGITFGPAIYHGDLNVGNFTFKRSTGMAASLFGQYYFSNVFGFRISLYSGILNGGIKTYEKSGTQVEDSFTGIILEGDLHMIVNFSNLFFKPSPRRKFFVYGMVGLGYGGWYSKLTNKVYNYDSLQYDNPLSNFNASFVVPAGLGFYYRIGNRLNLGFEYSYKTYFSDKLDNSTGGYPYDAVHYVALNLSFNLGTGLAKGRGSKPRKSQQMQPSEYPVSYPVYTPPISREYSPPPEAGPVELPPSKMEYRREKPQSKASPKTREVFCYSVQIFAFDQHRYSAEQIKQHYHITEAVRLEKQGNVERFVVGKCTDLECARALKERMRKHGIQDAFIVAYQNGRRHHSVK